MAKPSSKDDLKEYALRKLGKPVLEINVDDDQIDDLIDDAIQLYHERHGEGIDRVFLKHQFTEAERTAMKGTNVDATLAILSIPPIITKPRSNAKMAPVT